MKINKEKLFYVLNQFESYIATVAFIIIDILLTLQVFSRYVIGKSFTWSEEVATMFFVLMIYCGYAAAVTNRKHIKVTALLEKCSFRVRKVLMVASDIIFGAFCLYVIPPFLMVVENLMNSKFPLTKLPKRYIYMLIPFALVLVAVRCVQDIYRLSKENEQDLGKSEPPIDVDALEREFLAEQEALKQAAEANREDKEG